MITARRTDVFTSVDNIQTESDICLLERKIQGSYANSCDDINTNEKLEEAKVRMQRNLDRLLNYEKYEQEESNAQVATIVEDKVIEEMPVQEEVKDEATVMSEDDFRPSSTTMQFGDDGSDIYNDLNKQKQEEKVSYRLNMKGRLVVALYAVAVAVILALIILNTGVLTTLNSVNAQSAKILDQKVSEYNAIVNEIDSISSDSYVSNIAENDFGMNK